MLFEKIRRTRHPLDEEGNQTPANRASVGQGWRGGGEPYG
jgi:hypothetical protein